MKEQGEPTGVAGEDLEAHSGSGEPTLDFSLFALGAVFLRHGRVILLSALALSFAAAAKNWLREPEYSTRAIIRGQQRQETDLLSAADGLAQRLGLSSAGRGLHPLRLKQVLNSREVLDSVGSRLYTVETEDGIKRLHLADLLEVRRPGEERRRRRVRGWLRGAVLVQPDLPTSSISIVVRSRWPRISQSIAQQLISEVDRFNVETRQTSSRAEREFIEGQLDSAAHALTKAEVALQEFKDANREYGEWSPLTVEHGRLAEDVTQKRRLYANLRVRYDDAKVSEVRDTPVITVIQHPFLPEQPASQGLIRGAASGFVAGGLVAFMVVLLVQYFTKSANAAVHRELRMAWNHFVASMPVPFLRNLKRK